VEFRCRLASANGEIAEGIYAAESESRLRHELEEKGFFVLSLQPRGAIGGVSLSLPRRRAVNTREFLVFNQELATLLKAGMPLVQSLDLLRRRIDAPLFRSVLDDIYEKVRAGTALSDAFGAHGGVFPRVYTASLLAGERSGNLDAMLRRYVEYTKIIATVKRKTVSALVYPAILSGLALILVSIIVLTVLYLRYAFALFPWTYGVAVNIDQWFFAPITVLWSGFVAKMPNLIFLAVLALVVRYALRLVYLFFVAIGEGKLEFKDFDPSWSEPTYKLVRVAIIAFALIVAYPYIPGSSSEAFKGVSIFFGVVFSLGSTSTISNLLAGYMMIYRRAFREGDVVKIAGLLGYVSRVRLQVTHLRNAKNEEIVIPNSTILAGEVINYSSLAKSDGLILHTTVGIGYETPWRQVEAMLIEAAERTEGIRKDSKPFVLQTALGDFAVTYEINVYCEEPRRMLRIYSALHGNILDVFNEYGIQIMTPAYEGDPDEPKIVPRDKWHTPPAAKL